MLGVSDKNPTDPKIARDFLIKYSTDKLQDASRLNYNALSDKINRPLAMKVTKDAFLERFKKLNITLDPTENSIKADNMVLRPDLNPLSSYEHAVRYVNQNFSLLDTTFPFRTSSEIVRIKNTLGIDKYPTILINSYKFKMMHDFYRYFNIRQVPKDIIYKIFILTIMAVMGTTEVFGSLSESDVSMIIYHLKQPPSFEFCQLWMEAHEFAYIVHNINDEICYIFNNIHFRNNIYIEFEFHSKQLMLLKSLHLRN